MRYIPYAPHYVPIQQFFGGMSSDEAIGTSASFSYSRALEHRRNPSQLTVLPGPRKISSGGLQDLILNIRQVTSGTRYAMGDQGYVYKIDTANAVTYFNKLPTGSDGMLFRSDNDAMYCATQTDIRRFYPMSGTPTQDVTYGPSKSIDTNAYRTGGTVDNYTLPTAITENDYCSFQPDIEPFYSIKVNVTTPGTGDLTLTLHDGLNNVLATSTITAANVKSGLNEFVFSSQIRALVKPNARTYHFHLTASTGTTKIATSTASNLNTADFELWAYRLVQTTSGFHPMAQFLQYNCIGNGNYLAVWEPLSDSNPPNSEFQRHRIVLPAGYEIVWLAPTDEFLVMGAAKYSTDGTKDFQSGKLFVWDGTATTYNYVIDVSGGAPEGGFTKDNLPYFIANGKLCCWAGGKNIIQVRKIASLDNTYTGTIDNTHIYPNCMAVKDNLLHMGYPSTTTNQAIEHGIYVWGSLEKNFPESFNYGYVASAHQANTFNTSGNLKIGCVRSFGDEMYLSWRDSSSNYGLDIIDNNCNPAPIFKFRARRFDGGLAYKDKQALKQVVAFAAMPNTVSLTAVSSINGAAYVNGLTATTGTERVVSPVNAPNNFKRIVIGFDGTCSSTSSPTIYAQVLQYNPLIEQAAV